MPFESQKIIGWSPFSLSTKLGLPILKQHSDRGGKRRRKWPEKSRREHAKDLGRVSALQEAATGCAPPAGDMGYLGCLWVGFFNAIELMILKGLYYQSMVEFFLKFLFCEKDHDLWRNRFVLPFNLCITEGRQGRNLGRIQECLIVL